MDAYEGVSATVGSWTGNVWGFKTAITLYGCDNAKLRSNDYVRRGIKALCSFMGVKPEGSCSIKNFGEEERVAGFSVFQVVDVSSNVTAHLANASNRAFFTIFTHIEHDASAVADFLRVWFRASSYVLDPMAVGSVYRGDLVRAEPWVDGLWGYETTIALEGCDVRKARDATYIRRCVRELCVLIAMKRYGPCRVKIIDLGGGTFRVWVYQLIETSNTMFEFDLSTGRAHIIIFSCKEYDPAAAATFLQEKFDATNHSFHAHGRK